MLRMTVRIQRKERKKDNKSKVENGESISQTLSTIGNSKPHEANTYIHVYINGSMK